MNKNLGCAKAPDKLLELFLSLYPDKSNIIKILDIKLNDIYEDKQAHKIIEMSIKSLLSKSNYNNERFIFLGGDHSITYPTYKAIHDVVFAMPNNLNKQVSSPINLLNQTDQTSKNYRNQHHHTNKDTIGLVVFDAHPDCVSSDVVPTHEDWLRSLISHHYIDAQDVYIIGVRDIDKTEQTFITSNKIKVFHTQDVFNNIEDFTESLMSNLLKYKYLYISIDIDVLDPAFAPATGYPSPGGLATRELFYMLMKLSKLRNLMFIDIVEINPIIDKQYNYLTSSIGARLISIFL